MEEEYKKALKDQLKNATYKAAKEKSEAAEARRYLNKLWYTSPAFPFSDKDGNPVPTAPYPIRFKGNWLWEHKMSDMRYTQQEFVEGA